MKLVVGTTKILKSINIVLKVIFSSFDDNLKEEMLLNDCFRN